MEHRLQIELGREMFSALQERRTSLAETIYQNPISDYVCAEQAALEQQRLFRDYPLVMALTGDLPEPGDYHQ